MFLLTIARTSWQITPKNGPLTKVLLKDVILHGVLWHCPVGSLHLVMRLKEKYFV
jgi:hypothetical protein